MNSQIDKEGGKIFKIRTVRCKILELIPWLALFFLFIVTGGEVSAQKLVDSKIDRWYRMEPDWGVLKVWPDKFQHLFFPYLLQELNQRTIASERMFWLMNLGGVLKEFDDKEGISFRDIFCNTLGFWGAKISTDRFVLVPTFSVQKQTWKVVASVAF